MYQKKVFLQRNDQQVGGPEIIPDPGILKIVPDSVSM